jgi:NADH-quinone oxidoreductase subunit H
MGLIQKTMALSLKEAQNLLAILQFVSFFIRIAVLMFLFVWVRWTFPRFRFDQLMKLGWKILFPLAMGNLVVVIMALYYFRG